MNIFGALPGAVAQGLVWAIMAIGLFLTYKVLDFADLTVDGSICTGGVVFAILVTNGVSPWIGIFVAFVAGMLAGLMTGLFHTLFGIPPILSGILTQLSLWSLNLKILGKANVSVSARTFNLIVTQLRVGESVIVLLAVVGVIIALLYLLFGTEIGSAIRATGSNPQMSRAQGINTNVTKVLGLMISNGLVAFAGAFLTQYQGFADINMGRGAIVIGLAAIVIGEALTSLIGKNFALRLAGVGVGAIIYFVVYQIIIALGLDTELLKLLSALLVAIFLAIPFWKNKVRKSKKTMPALKEKTDA